MEIVYVILGFVVIGRNMIFAELLSPIFIFSALSLFLYYIPYIILEEYIKENLLELSYLEGFYQLVFLSLLAFTIAYTITPEGNINRIILRGKAIDDNIDYDKFKKYAIVTGLIGLVFYSYFIFVSGFTYFLGHNAGDFSVGGYIYELRYFIFSSILMLYSLKLMGKTEILDNYLILGFTGFLMFDAYIQQVRGSWIRLMVIYGFSYGFFFLANKGYKKLKTRDLLSRYISLLPLVPVPILLLTYAIWVRTYSYLPFLEQISLFFNDLSENPLIIFMGSAPDEGNEFVCAYNAFMAREISGVYDMGLKWIYPFLNFIPRALWSAKPNWMDFSISTFDIINKFSFIRIPMGSVVTGFIDAFYRFSWFSPLFFGLLGFEYKKLYTKAFYGSLHSKCLYVCAYIGLFYFLTQDGLPFVIFTVYMYVPIYVCFKFSKK